MSLEKNKTNARRLLEEAINKGNLALVDEIVAPNYVYHNPRGDIKGTEGLKQFFTMLRTAFPDVNVSVEDMIAEGDTVAYRFTIRGTHKGVMMGIAPTGKQIVFPEAHFIRFKGSKEVEEWPYADSLSLYRQLGVPISNQ